MLRSALLVSLLGVSSAFKFFSPTPKPSAPIAISRLENIAISRAPTHELRMLISKETAAASFSVLRAAADARAPTAVTKRANLRLARLADSNELEFEWKPSISTRAPKAEQQELEFEWR